MLIFFHKTFGDCQIFFFVFGKKGSRIKIKFKDVVKVVRQMNDSREIKIN